MFGPESFTPAFFRQLQQLRIRTRRNFLGTRQGHHISKRRGHGLEFSDFRLYTPGDDFRHIDWSVYGRTDRLYVREFRDEQDLNVLFLLDASTSMGLPAESGKFELARDLALALGYVALAGGDTVTYSFLGQRNTPRFRGAKALPRAYRELQSLKPEGSFSLLDEVRAAAARHKIPGKCFLISDFLVDLNVLMETLDHLRFRNFEVALLQVLSPAELELSLDSGDALVEDAETGELVELSLGAGSKRDYASVLANHIAAIEAHCRRREIVHLLVSSAQSLSDVVLTRLPDLGLLK